MIITIDGPAASGKSSVAKAIAKELNIYYLYTGLFYRAIAYFLGKKALEQYPDLSQKEALEKFMQNLSEKDLEFVNNFTYDYADGIPHIFYKSEEITEKLYLQSLEKPASIVSTHKLVRKSILEKQRTIAQEHDLVADGRDTGSIVFPNADHKFYLTASVDVRAQRLMLDETRGDFEKNIAKVKGEIQERDERDKSREIAPLTIPENATIIDNSYLNLQETINKILKAIKQ